MTVKFDARVSLAAHLNIDIKALRRKYVFQREAQLALDEIAELVDFWLIRLNLIHVNQVDDEVDR